MHFVLYSPQYDFLFSAIPCRAVARIFAYDGRRGRAGGKNAGGNDRYESTAMHFPASATRLHGSVPACFTGVSYLFVMKKIKATLSPKG